MGKSKKPSLGESLKASFDIAKGGAARIAKVSAKAVKDSADIVSQSASDVAKVSAKAIKDGAVVVADKSKELADAVDKKSRESLDKAYKSKRKAAVENLAKYRAANPKANPSELLDILESDLHKLEEKRGVESDEFMDATVLFVLTVVELYPNNKSTELKRQKLIDTILVLDSEVVKTIAAIGGLALELLPLGKVGKLGKIAKAAVTAKAKAASLSALAKKMDVKNPGKKGAAWLAVNITKKSLGEPPKAWPASESKK